MKKIDPIKRLVEEQRIIDKMIALYCRDCHGGNKGDKLGVEFLCDKCHELRDYTKKRNDLCPFIETRSFCRYCQTHCYKPDMRARISEAMRYSGPRMIFHEPIFAVRHLCEQRRQKKLARGGSELEGQAKVIDE
jgi:hypothetical protein